MTKASEKARRRHAFIYRIRSATGVNYNYDDIANLAGCSVRKIYYNLRGQRRFSLKELTTLQQRLDHFGITIYDLMLWVAEEYEQQGIKTLAASDTGSK